MTLSELESYLYSLVDGGDVKVMSSQNMRIYTSKNASLSIPTRTTTSEVTYSVTAHHSNSGLMNAHTTSLKLAYDIFIKESGYDLPWN